MNEATERENEHENTFEKENATKTSQSVVGQKEDVRKLR